jgi:hypothetical protein
LTGTQAKAQIPLNKETGNAMLRTIAALPRIATILRSTVRANLRAVG